MSQASASAGADTVAFLASSTAFVVCPRESARLACVTREPPPGSAPTSSAASPEGLVDAGAVVVAGVEVAALVESVTGWTVRTGAVAVLAVAVVGAAGWPVSAGAALANDATGAVMALVVAAAFVEEVAEGCVMAAAVGLEPGAAAVVDAPLPSNWG